MLDVWSRPLVLVVFVAASLVLAVGVALVRGDPDQVASSPHPQEVDSESASQLTSEEIFDELVAPGLDADDLAASTRVVSSLSGYSRDEAGARAAALAYLELTEDVVELLPEDAGEVSRLFSTDEYSAEAAADTERRMTELLDAVPDGVKVRLAPIEMRSVESDSGWMVSIWFVEVITVGLEGVVDDWRTAVYELEWEQETWKVAGFTSRRGPTPGRGAIPASVPVSEFEGLLAGFDDLGLNR